MNNRQMITVRAYLNEDDIFCKTKFEGDAEFQFATQVVHLQNETIKHALRKLGYILPEDSCALCKHVQHIDNGEVACSLHCGFLPENYRCCGRFSSINILN